MPQTATHSSGEIRIARFVLCVVLAVNALALSPELSSGLVTGNDNVSHLALVAGMVRAVENGDNPLDFWSPEGTFGSAPIRTYQPLSHILVTLTYFALGKGVALPVVFLWLRYLAVVLLPAGVFAGVRLLGLPPLTAAAGAALAPLIATDAWYGLDYSSYIAVGRGLYPQSVAAILLLPAIGAGVRTIRSGTHGVLAGILLGLTAITHFIFGWIAAVTLCLAVVLPVEAVPLRLRVRRIAGIGLISLILSAFQLLPVWLDRGILNHSRWEDSWKWDSFGAATVLKALFTGEILDHGRLPVLSLLGFLGAVLVLTMLYRTRRLQSPECLVLFAAVLWTLVFFGRSTWGPLLLLLGAVRDLQLHRVVSAVQVFLILLAAIAIETGLRQAHRRGIAWVAILGCAACLAIMLQERAAYLARSQAQATAVMIDVSSEEPSADALIAALRQTGGRVFAGSGTGWGARFQIGNIPFFALLNMRLVPQVSAPYQLSALTADLLPSFDERRPEHYRLANVRSVAIPAKQASEAQPFLPPRLQIGRYRILDAPGHGYFDFVEAPGSAAVDKANFYEVNRAWLESPWVDRRAHLWLDFAGAAAPPAGLPRLPPKAPLPLPAASPDTGGQVLRETQAGQRYSAQVAVARPALLLFKMTWHPNWIAYVDGKAQPTAMLSPGFVGVPLPPGEHGVQLAYQPGFWKLGMALAGFAIALMALAAEKRGYLTILGFAAPAAR